MIRCAVLALGTSYACLWFVNVGGQAFDVAALVLLVAGLAFAVLDAVVPTSPCPCQTAPADRPDDDLEPLELDDDLEPLELDEPQPALVAPEPAELEPVVAEPADDLTARRLRAGYSDPDTTGPIPVVGARHRDNGH